MELGILELYVVLYLIWSLICVAINSDWPYMVQNRIGSNSVASFFAHAAMCPIFAVSRSHPCVIIMLVSCRVVVSCRVM